MSFVDFDGVSYHLSTLENQDTQLVLSIRWKCWSELRKYGAMDVLKREYSQWIVDPEPGYDFTLQFDQENLGADPGTTLFSHAAGTSSHGVLTRIRLICSPLPTLLADIVLLIVRDFSTSL